MKTRLLRLAGTEAGKATDEDDKRRMWTIISLRKATPNFHLSNVACNSNFAYCPLQTSPPRPSFSTSPLSLPSLLLLLLPSSLKENFTCACAPVWFWSDWLFRSLLIPQAAASRIRKRKISFFSDSHRCCVVESVLIHDRFWGAENGSYAWTIQNSSGLSPPEKQKSTPGGSLPNTRSRLFSNVFHLKQT